MFDWTCGFKSHHSHHFPLFVCREKNIGYARVVELADSLDSGSSAHYGRAGSSPASRTTSFPDNFIQCARVVELADSLDSGSSAHYGRAGSSPASRTRSSVLTACGRLWEHSLFIQRVHRGGAVDDCAFSFVYGHFRDRQGQRRMLSKRSLGRLEQRKTGFYYPVDKTDHFLLAVLVIALHNDMHQAV